MDHLIYAKFLNFWQRQKKAYAVFQEALKKFQGDRCYSHGNAIAYSIVISIIPLLTILVQLAKVQRNVVQNSVASFLSAYGLSDSAELLAILDDILSRAGTIAGVGFIFVLYAATNFFRNLEDAFNHIYKAQKKRPLLYRFSQYISIFVVLPLLVIFTSQAIQSIYYYFQTPEIRQVLLRNDKEWHIASNGNIRIYKENKIRHKINLKEKAPPGAPYRDILIDPKNKVSGYPWELKEKTDYSYEVKSPKRYKLVGGAQNVKSVYLISEGATLFHSNDEGQSWQYQQVLLYSDEGSYAPYVKDIHMNKKGQLMLLIDESGHSTVLTLKGKRKWQYQALKKSYESFIVIRNIKKRDGPFKNGLYLCGKGVYLHSDSEGESWQGPFEEKYGDRKLQIKVMRADAEGNMYFGGNRGAFWIHRSSEILYPDIRSSFDQDIENLVSYADGTMFLYGKGNLFRYSEDWGRVWRISKQKIFTERNILSHQKLSPSPEESEEKSLYFSADGNTLILAKKPRLTKEKDNSGRAFVSLDYKLISHASFWSSLFYRLLVEPLFLLLVFISLCLLYILVPNAKVDRRAACLGAGFASLGLVLFLFCFRIWIANFKTTGYIYGVWAAFPLGMIIILVSTQIVLFGLELSFVIQNKKR